MDDVVVVGGGLLELRQHIFYQKKEEK